MAVRKEEAKDMNNFIARNGTYYVKAMSIGAIVKQSLHTSGHEVKFKTI